MKNTRYFGTITYLAGQSAAMISLTDSTGEWAGAGRVEVRSGRKADLYEEGYRHASQMAQSKGGTLDRYRVEA